MRRRQILWGGLALCLSALTACDGGSAKLHDADQTSTKVYVLGTIHGAHKRSEIYSLDVLRRALKRSNLDVLISEIPPDRIDEAYRGFRETGQVTERRTRAFPEYTDVAFPLARELDFEIVGAAGWTSEIADDRAEALDAIKSDPARAQQWDEHVAAQRGFNRAIGDRRNDPRFIHTDEYDRLAARSRRPYQKHFDADLGEGGWTAINAAHSRLINAELDKISGQGLTAVVTFGALHKHLILNSIMPRDDVELLDPLPLFSEP